MGRERIRTREFIYLCIASLILFICFSCALLDEKEKMGLKKEEAKGKGEASKILSEHLFQARKLLEQRDFDGSIRENQKVLSLAGQNPPADEALFNLGLIYAHSGNPRKDYGKSVGFFRKLMKDYPQSPLAVQARIWTGVLLENEKMSLTIQKLNQVIEESKQVDIEIEEKKREKGK